MDVLVEALGVSKVFRSARAGDVTAIERIDLQVADGEFVSVLGPSGCGKSTFLFMVAGFEAPTGGRISVGGEPVTRPGPDRGVVFQEYALFPWLTVLDNVAYGLREQGMDRREREEIARRYVAQVGLEGFADRRPHELSGGMRQRVALARVLAIRPNILLMDEPFGALDEQTRFLQDALLRIWERERKTVIFVTHSLEEAVFLSDRVVVMTARPGRVKEIVSIDLPRPRERTSEDFNTIRRRLAKAPQDEVLAAQRDWESDDEETSRWKPLPRRTSICWRIGAWSSSSPTPAPTSRRWSTPSPGATPRAVGAAAHRRSPRVGRGGHGPRLLAGLGPPQAVMVHVTVGTANAACGIITAARSQVPLLLTAGRTPITEEGLPGARDLYIHWAQESFDQAAMVREYVKWDYELRTPVQLEAVVDRAFEVMLAEPRGPVYLTLPREVLASGWIR